MTYSTGAPSDKRISGALDPNAMSVRFATVSFQTSTIHRLTGTEGIFKVWPDCLRSPP